MRWTFAVVDYTQRPKGAPIGLPFSIEPFGAFRRLVWPRGAIQLDRGTRVAGWGRFALVGDFAGLWLLIDAERDDVLRFKIEPRYPLHELAVDGDTIAATSYAGVLRLPLTDLERLAPGKHEVFTALEFPQRRPEVRLAATVKSDKATMIVQPEGIHTDLRLEPEKYHLEPGEPVVVGDELVRGAYGYIEVIGQPRRPIDHKWIADPIKIECKRERRRDPAAGVRDVMAPLAPDQVSLLAQIAAGDDLARGVLIDLLADRGDHAAETFALARAGAHVTNAKQRAALGPLAHFFEVELSGGLPAIATLIRHPPDDAESLAALFGDLRLGLISELRSGNSPPALYHRLLASPALVSLRRVEAPTPEALALLREHHAGKLTHLARVPFANQLAIAMLADKAFASVTHVELQSLRRNHAPMAFVAALPALPGKHVRFVRHAQASDAELARLLRERLPELGFASLEVNDQLL